MSPSGSIRDGAFLHSSDDENRMPSSDEAEVNDPPETYNAFSDDDSFLIENETDEGEPSTTVENLKRLADNSHLLSATTIAYLKAREDDKIFHRNVLQDKELLSMVRTVVYPTEDERYQSQRDDNRKMNSAHTQADFSAVREIWFLATGKKPVADPFFGFVSLDQDDSISLDAAPEDMSAHFPLKRHHRTLSDESQSDKSSIDAFRLVANVSSVAAGRYGLYLKLKEIGDETAEARFSVRVLVRYRDMRMVKPFYTRFFKSSKDDCSEWCYLKADNLFEIYPHIGVAHVNIYITPDLTFKEVRGQLLIRSLRLILVGGSETLGPEPVLSRSILAHYPISIHPTNGYYGPDDHRFGGSPPGGIQEANDLGVISRLAVSKNGIFLAALVIIQNQFAVKVWRVDEQRNGYQLISQSEPVVATHDHENAGRLPLELDISATGEYIAVFQTPRIGDWNQGTVLPKSNIGVRLFRNTQSDSRDHLAISVDDRAGFLAEHHDPRPTPLVEQNTPDALKQAIGYAAFVDEFKSEEHTLPTRFVFCNGLYLDVYELQSNGLIHNNTIPLYHMNSALHRATACALMVRSIAINMFIWVEDNGRYCTAWDLSNGSAISRFEIAGLQFGGFANATSTQVACNQNIIAIVGHDNTITTVDAFCGIVISRRLILDSVIEDIAFPSARSQMLIVKIRGESDNQQTTLILDPLRLDIQEQIQFMPPLSSLTILGLSGPKPWPEIGVVCWPDENRIRVYECKQPTVQIHGARAPIANDVVDMCPYELRFTIPARPNGATGGNSLTRQVEVWTKGERSTQVFSFVPEPWELHKAVDGRILPPWDRFVVYASWTIQLWSLPTADEPRCRLLFFWSIANNTNVKGELGNSDLETVLESHTRFNSAYIHEYWGSDDQKRFRVTVVSPLKSVMQVQIPSSHNLYSDSQVTAKSCIEGIWLLALSHSMISVEHQGKHGVEKYSGDNRDHVSAIVEFVNGYINHSVLQDWSNERTVLTHLLEISNLSDLSAKFITALLESDHCSWIPSIMTSSRPIALAVQHRNTTAVRAILDYCTRKAAESHPAYLMPVEHSFKDLVEVYPELLRDFFRRASYIPAQRADFNKKYVATSAYSWDLTKDKLLSWISRSKKKHVETVGYKKQTFSFQLKKSRNTNHRRETIPQWPANLDPIRLQYDCMVYVAPFPSLITLGTGSQFHLLAGKGFFDSPALMAVLRYKTWQYGLFYWIYRYIWLAVFYGTFLATTSAQLQSSKSTDSLPGPISRYLGDYWIVIPIIGLFAGSYLLVEEILQLATFGNSRYLKSLYNYVEVTSILLTMICLGQTIHTFWMQGPDSYQQFGLTSFAIMAMYLHVIAETRIFKGVGTIVNTIVLVVHKIWSFLFVFLLIIIATTHSLFYLQQAYQTECNESGVCTRSSPSHPYNVFSSFATTLFFMAGRYSSVEADFQSQNTSFLLLMILFYFLSTIVMMTVLIALVVDTLHETRIQGEQARKIQLSEDLAEAELMGRFVNAIERWVPIFGRISDFFRKYLVRRRPQHSPTFIYYIASVHDAEAHKKMLRERS